MAREKLKDFLRSIGATSDMISYTIEDEDLDGLAKVGDDLGIDPETGQPLVDLDVDAIGLLGDYAKFIVDMSDNLFTVEGGNKEAASSNRGDSIVLAENTGVTRPFISQGETLGSVMSSYSNSGIFGEDLDKILDKTGKVSPKMKYDGTEVVNGGPLRSGNTLLSSIEGAPAIPQSGITEADSTSYTPESLAQEVVENFISKNNRFSPSKKEFKAYSPVPTDTTDFDSGKDDVGTATSQSEIGKFDKNSIKMINDSLKDVGSSLLLKMAGWDNAVIPGDSSNPNTFDFDKDDNLDSSNSPMRQIDPELFRARSAYNSPQFPKTGMSTRAGKGSFLTQDDLFSTKYTYSFGTTTTDATPFSSEFNQDILIAQAAAAIAAMLVIAQETFGQIDNMVNERARLGNGPYFAGQSTIIATQAKFELIRNIVLTPTKYPYSDAVNQGFLVLFDGELGGDPSQSDDIGKYQQIQEAPGFWLAVARSVLRSFEYFATVNSDIMSGNVSSSSSTSLSNILHSISMSGILNILNVAATIGDISLKMNGGMPGINSNNSVGPWNIDSLADGPGTRISKSRSQDGLTSLSLAWRTSSTPALYMIPRNVMRAAEDMGTLVNGTNPLKGMMGSNLIKKTYIDASAEGPNARIPGDIVERMENALDAEYVPFYFHDLRTNEIVSFHAFLTRLTDSFNPSFIRTSGYGRMDEVQVFKNTTRSIALSFYIVATSKDDFNEMWWKINKLTTLVYPSWTKGTKVTVGSDNKESIFTQPFSQVLGASPVIRMRVGDVIKGNYSKFNLARMFGIGDEDVMPVVQGEDAAVAIKPATPSSIAVKSKLRAEPFGSKAFSTLFASPLTLLGDNPPIGTTRAARAVLSQLLVNGFANPLGLAAIVSRMKDPDRSTNIIPLSPTAAGALTTGASILAAGSAGTGLPLDGFTGYKPSEIVYLKATMARGYKTGHLEGGHVKQSPDNSSEYRVTRPVKCMVIWRSSVALEGKGDAQSSPTFKGPKRRGNPRTKTSYAVTVIDLGAPIHLMGKIFIVDHSDLLPNPDLLFNSTVMPTISMQSLGEGLAQALADVGATASGVPSDQMQIVMSDAARFMDENNNPITKAFASTAGRGLAGVMTRLDFDWLDESFNWEIDWNSRAPMGVKVDIAFTPIHDLPPGLDHSGYNRAPIYNVGDIMRYVAGDPYPDDGAASEDSYTRHGGSGAATDNPASPYDYADPKTWVKDD